MDWHFIIKAMPLFGKAAILTLTMGLIGTSLALFVGLLCEIVIFSRIPIASQIVKAYIELSRNTPLLILLFFIYYGLPKIGVRMSATASGIAGLVFLGGGYMAETFRSGVETIGKGQLESATSLGLSQRDTMRYIIMPQAVLASYEGLAANMVFLIKETSVFSAIGLMDLMFTAKDLIGLYYNTTECLIMLALSYFLILLPVLGFAEILLSAAKKRKR